MDLRQIKFDKVLLLICAIGAVIRIAFFLWGAELYFGRADFYIDGDTGAYVRSIINLIDHGSYNLPTVNHIDRFFVRPPGYPFFIAPFYLLSGQSLELTYQLVIWSQILLDVVSVWLIFRISIIVFKNVRIAQLAALLYALYPFIIVWTPVIYAEAASVFFLLLALYQYVKGTSKLNLVLTGVFLSIACLMRPQIALIIPIIAFVILLTNKNNLAVAVRKLLMLGIPILLLYGAWPARNYVNHDRLVFVQDLGGVEHWAPDYLSFMEYVYSVKTDHEPQYSQIVLGKEVVFPAVSYHTREDSLKLTEVIELCRTCGEGFSFWMNTAKIRSTHEFNSKCTRKIETLFLELKENQMTENWFHYYFTIPFNNLGKALFKFKLYDATGIRRIGSVLFMYRTLLIILGLLGLFWLFKDRHPSWYFHLVIALFTFSWYFYLCAIHRNMEIRYLLPVDVLLLFPASYVLVKLKDLLFPGQGN